MTNSRLEVADVIRLHGEEFMASYGRQLSRDQRKVLRAIADCRTAAMGGHVESCQACGHTRIAYNSCRNRHCPKCQAKARALWMQKRERELLPIPYFHVVFTLPAAVGPIALQNKEAVYGILFEAAAQTLRTIAADPKHLGAEIGALAVLHTWGQNLMHHPHLHSIVTGGGLSRDGRHWIACRRAKRSRKVFFAPVKVLGRVFRGKFIALLKQAYRQGKLSFFGEQRKLASPAEFERWLDGLVRNDWVVYAKRPFGGSRQVLKYVARYTHRVAIANRRLMSLNDGQVQFEWKDFAAGGKQKTMKLAAVEFLRRFLLHVLPRGFVRIRHYGFLANRCKGDKLARCQTLLGADTPPDVVTDEDASQAIYCLTLISTSPDCGSVDEIRIEEIGPSQSSGSQFHRNDRTRPPPRGMLA